MAVNKEAYLQIKQELDAKHVTLVAVSKTKPASDILELYELGQRDFGENYVQELVDKAEQLPKDIRWHFIGHLQSNKVKYIAPFVHLIHGVDSRRLAEAIDEFARVVALQQALVEVDDAAHEAGMEDADAAVVEQVDARRPAALLEEAPPPGAPR